MVADQCKYYALQRRFASPYLAENIDSVQLGQPYRPIITALIVPVNYAGVERSNATATSPAVHV